MENESFDQEPTFYFGDRPSASKENKSESNTSKTTDPLSKKGRLFLVVFGVLLFLFFLILKLPEARVQNYLLGHIRIIAQNMGYTFQAEKVSLGIIFGPSLKIENAKLKSVDDDSIVIPIEYLKIKPHITSLLPFFTMKKVSFSLRAFNGEASGVVGIALNSKSLSYRQQLMEQISLDITAEEISVPKILNLFPNIPISVGSSTLDLKSDLFLDFVHPEVSTGKLHSALKNTLIPAQSMLGFNLPQVQISQIDADLSVSQGKILVRNFTIGQDIKKDDVVAKVTGELLIDNQANALNPLERFKLNNRIVFELSPKLKGSFPFLDAILGPAKDANGKYNYGLRGTLAFPSPQAGG